MSLYNDKRIAWLKRVFPEGTRICLEKMVDDPYPVEPNTQGDRQLLNLIITVIVVIIGLKS